jgi:SAM-dependent methyltransferase
MSHHHDPHHHQHDHHHDGLAEVLDLDAEVLAGPLSGIQTTIGDLADAPVRSILDLGAGTGTGTFALLQHFVEARALAVDDSEEMLARLRERAEQLGFSERISTLRANLDEGVPDVDPVDLAWASASLHHLADPDLTLARLEDIIRPGGLLAVVELSGHPRFLSDGTPEGVAEARAHALIAADRAVELPTMGEDWGPRLARAGLVVEVEQTIVVDLAPPLAPVVGRYAAAVLSRIRGAVEARLLPADLEAFDSLLDGGPGDVRLRDDLHVRTARQLWIARRT